MAERTPMIAANWKMHKTHLESIQAVQKLSYLLDRKDAERVEVVICPAFTALRSVQTLIDSDRLPYGLGAQDIHPEDEGAFTGAVSGPMLAALDVALRHRRSFRAPPAVRRGRRDGEPEGEGRDPQRDGADRLRGGDARGAGVGRHRDEGDRAGPAGLRRDRRDGRGRVRRRLRADLGDRHGPQRGAHRRGTGRGGDPRDARGPSLLRRSPTRSASSTEAASSRATSGSSWLTRRSTGRWSEGRASIRKALP